MYIGLHVKYPLFLSDLNETWIFLTYFQKMHNIKFHKNPSMGAQKFYAGGQPDMTKLRVAFRKIAKSA